MKLVSLQCDRPSFKTLVFRPRGLSVIVGDNAEREGSANGVGKTLALKLVHHCLGARRDETLARGVGNWRFALDFEVSGERHRIERNGDGSAIERDGTSVSLEALHDWLDRHGSFVLPSDRAALSFRALYGRFARRNPGDRIDPIGLEHEQPHEALLRTLYLLGADISLVLRKIALREHTLKIESARKLFKQSDSRLRELLHTGMDVQAQSEDLAERIASLRQRLQAMQVAEHYEHIRQHADALTREVRARETRIAQIDFQLTGIERALQMQPDIEREALLGFYQGLEHVFKPESLARFEAVEQFHRSLAEQRQARLMRDRLSLEAERQRVEDERSHLARERDAKLVFLAQHHALDDYMAVAQQLARMESDLALLRQYGDTEHQWKEEKLRLRRELTEDDERADQYLANKPLQSADRTYRALVHALYPQETAGIVLNNNTRGNKLRYDLKVQVQGQGSDGINAVRVMAFDWLVYRHGANHFMRHLWHDNGLFDHVDPNQRAAWLRLTRAELMGGDMQYVISLNTENYISTRSLIDEDAAWLDEAVIARLSGDADANKLLGARIGVEAAR